MKALSDYVHGKGLKLGIYSDAGYAQLTKENPQSQEKYVKENEAVRSKNNSMKKLMHFSLLDYV